MATLQTSEVGTIIQVLWSYTG